MALPLSYHRNESERWRVITGVRLALGGAVLGTSLVGAGGLIFGYQTHTIIDAFAAVAGGAIAALYIFGVNDD